MAQFPTPMIATRTLSFERAPFFEPFVVAMSFLSSALCCSWLGWDAEPISERGEDDVVRVGVAPRRLCVDLVLQLLRYAEEKDGAGAC